MLCAQLGRPAQLTAASRQAFHRGWCCLQSSYLFQNLSQSTTAGRQGVFAGLQSSGARQSYAGVSQGHARARGHSRGEYVLVRCQTTDAATEAASSPALQTEATGQVISAQANFMTVRVQQPASLQTVDILCTVRALLKKMQERVLVGDDVRLISIDWIDLRGVISEVVQRRSELQNPPVANVDQVLLAFSLAEPPWDGQVATRFLVSAEACGIPVTVLLNKADLVTPETQDAIQAQVASWGYRSILVSAHTQQGVPELRACLQSQLSVVAGPSGVGKSSLINSMNQLNLQQLRGSFSSIFSSTADSRQQNGASSAPAEMLDRAAAASQNGKSAASTQAASQQQEPVIIAAPEDGAASLASTIQLQPVGDNLIDRHSQDRLQVGTTSSSISSSRSSASYLRPAMDSIQVTSIGRGRHTTRHVALLEVAGGLLADTPGFNQPSLANLEPSDLPECFPEVREQLNTCAFRNCQHLLEPGCAVRDNWPRHAWYAELHGELTAADDLARHRSASKLRRQGRARYKTQAGGDARKEALLNPKSHRRINRKQVKQQMQSLLEEENHEGESDDEAE